MCPPFFPSSPLSSFFAVMLGDRCGIVLTLRSQAGPGFVGFSLSRLENLGITDSFLSFFSFVPLPGGFPAVLWLFRSFCGNFGYWLWLLWLFLGFRAHFGHISGTLRAPLHGLWAHFKHIGIHKISHGKC